MLINVSDFIFWTGCIPVGGVFVYCVFQRCFGEARQGSLCLDLSAPYYIP